MKIMGIDPGLADVGYGVIAWDERARTAGHVAHGVIRTPASDPPARRLQTIYAELRALIAEHRPDAVAVEQLFFARNVKTAMAVAQARGVAILATAESGAPLAEYSPPQIKLALTGQGRAGKRQVQLMVRALLNLKEIPRPDHAADALATALTHLHGLSGVGIARSASQSVNGDPPPEDSPAKALLAQASGKRKRRR